MVRFGFAAIVCKSATISSSKATALFTSEAKLSHFGFNVASISALYYGFQELLLLLTTIISCFKLSYFLGHNNVYSASLGSSHMLT